MNVGEIYTITSGFYSDKYIITAKSGKTVVFTRVMMPKTKINAVRLPEHIHISYFGTNITGTNKRKK